MRVHQITKRTYYKINIQVVSPISVSNGDNEYTDSDIIVDGHGDLFVPGTSLAGAFRNYLGVTKEKDCVYGYSKDKSGRMSAIYISDLIFDNSRPVIKSVRDGVALTEEKSVDNKFDMEIIEPGVTGSFHLEVIERDGDTYQFEDAVVQLINALQIGEIRIGANKNRGFGRLQILKIAEKSFVPENRADWIGFCRNGSDMPEKEYKEYADWIEDKKLSERKYIIVSRNLLLRGGISIRRYSAKPGKVDYEHITSNGKSVIPGTSWNGAIRSEAGHILRELGCGEKKTKKLIDDWFGPIVKAQKSEESEEETRKPHQSMIVISESIIDGARSVPMTRNKINRFTSGTKDGALYSEIACFDGKTKLEYMVKKDPDNMYKALIALMELVVDALSKGYVSVGGQAGIGRGIFETDPENPETVFDENDNIDLSECRSELYRVIKEN